MSVGSSHMDVDYNAYEGKKVQGDIDLVMARGKVLISDGEYHGSKGDGRFLKRGTCQLLV
jgi:dihydropyrimidinase